MAAEIIVQQMYPCIRVLFICDVCTFINVYDFFFLFIFFWFGKRTIKYKALLDCRTTNEQTKILQLLETRFGGWQRAEQSLSNYKQLFVMQMWCSSFHFRNFKCFNNLCISQSCLKRNLNINYGWRNPNRCDMSHKKTNLGLPQLQWNLEARACCAKHFTCEWREYKCERRKWLQMTSSLQEIKYIPEILFSQTRGLEKCAIKSNACMTVSRREGILAFNAISFRWTVAFAYRTLHTWRRRSLFLR